MNSEVIMFSKNILKIEFIDKLINFFKTLPSPQNYIWLSILGVIALFIIVFLLVLFFSNFRKRKRQSKKEEAERLRLLNEEVDALFKRLDVVERELSENKKQAVLLASQTRHEVEKLLDETRILNESEDYLNQKNKDKIAMLDEKQKTVSDIIKTEQRNAIKSMKPEKLSSAQAMLGKIASDKAKNESDLLERQENQKERQQKTSEKIAELNFNLEKALVENDDACAVLEKEKKEITDRLTELLGKDFSLSPADYFNTIREIEAQSEFETSSALSTAEDELQKAKLEYENAVKVRIKAEQDKEAALDNIRNDKREMRKLAVKCEKKGPYNDVAYTVDDDDNSDIKIIVSDLFGNETVLNPNGEQLNIQSK